MAAKTRDEKVALCHSNTPSPQIMWHAEKITGLHLWFDPLARNAIVVSDALYGEMKATGMTGFQAQESRAK